MHAVQTLETGVTDAKMLVVITTLMNHLAESGRRYAQHARMTSFAESASRLIAGRDGPTQGIIREGNNCSLCTCSMYLVLDMGGFVFAVLEGQVLNLMC
jgi:hypothetical protein